MESPVSVAEPSSNPTMSISPNPVCGSSTVSFYLPGTSEVSIKLLTALGQTVLSKTLGALDLGEHTSILEASHLNPGVYILQLKTNRGTLSRKISVIK